MKKLPYPFGFRGFSFNEMEIVMSDLKIEELTKEQEEFLASEKCNCRFHVDEYVYLPKFCLFLACFKYSSFYYACDTDTLLELPNNSEPSFILGNRYLQFSGGEADAIATARLTASQCGFLPGSKIDFAFGGKCLIATKPGSPIKSYICPNIMARVTLPADALCEVLADVFFKSSSEICNSVRYFTFPDFEKGSPSCDWRDHPGETVVDGKLCLLHPLEFKPYFGC